MRDATGTAPYVSHMRMYSDLNPARMWPAPVRAGERDIVTADLEEICAYL